VLIKLESSIEQQETPFCEVYEWNRNGRGRWMRGYNWPGEISYHVLNTATEQHVRSASVEADNERNETSNISQQP
jgi:hypothetical protein